MDKLRNIQAARASAAAGLAATDMTYHGGAVVQGAQSFFLALNCNQTPFASCWGNPSGFLGDLFASSFIHITDQYVNSTANGRYNLATMGVNLSGAEPHIMQVSDVQAAVIAGFRALFPNGGGGGYGNIYNLLLPPGQDTCFSPTDCYSPDNDSAWKFCAYHSSMDVPDARGNLIHVLYTVMPYQNVTNGIHTCQVQSAPFPNGQLADSTDSTLSHEIFELITDPDATAWYYSPLGVTGEIGDLCAQDIRTFTINGHTYEVQTEYDNASHGCSTGPTSTQPPPTCTISYTPSTVTFGQSLSVSWGATNATSRTYGIYDSANNLLFASSTAVSSSTTVASFTSLPPGNYTRRDTVTGSGGTATCSATLTVAAGSTTCTISYSPSTVTFGQSLSVSWASSNATSRTYGIYDSANNLLFASSTAVSGALSVASFTNLPPGAYTRRDTVTGSGSTGTCSATLIVVASSVTCAIVYTPPTIKFGQPLTVTWNATNATSRTYNVYNFANALLFSSPGISVSGTFATSSFTGLPVGSYTRQDTVNGPGGSGTCSATLTIN